MLSTEKAIIRSIAITYLGPSEAGKNHGLQMLPSWDSKFTIAVAQARFSGVWFSDDAAQEYTVALAANVPAQYRRDAKWRARIFRVEAEIAKPMIATAIGAIMW
jgi:hypothetical protein